MSVHKPVILLTFANPRPDSGGYLPMLIDEAELVSGLLKPYEVNDLCAIDKVENATAESVFETVEVWNRRKDIVLFHYGGHADGGALFLNKRDGNTIPATAKGLAELLGKLSALQLVFLNGCSTHPQVELLLEAGVKAVIATSKPINDSMAKDLAGKFYENLAAGSTIGESWDQARIFIEFKYDFQVEKPTAFRGLKFHVPSEKKDQELPWGLYLRPGVDDVLSWRLPQERTTKSSFSLLDKYTCNRSEQNSRFKTNFLKSRGNKKFQFYLIHGEEEQSPQGLFQRFSLEHISTAYNRIFYKDVKLEEAHVMEEAQINLQTAMFQALEMNPNRFRADELTIATLAKSKIAKEMDCVALKFRVYSSEWKPFTPKFIHWAVTELCDPKKLPENAPDFIFFVSVVYDDDMEPKGFFKRLLKGSSKQKIIKIVSKFEEVLPLPELPSVYRNDINKWFDRLTKDPDVKQAAIAKHFADKDEMAMSRVEKKLEAIIEDFNDKNIK